MLRYAPILIGGFLTCNMAFAGQPSKAPESVVVIKATRHFAQGTLPANATWQGLYCQELECEVRTGGVQITSSSGKNALGETEPLDALTATDKPVALFANLALSPGKVPTWFVMTKAYGESKQYRKLTKLGKWDMHWGSQPLTLTWVKTPEGMMRYHVSHGTTKQFLFSAPVGSHFGGETTPVIQWVGDLDGDGKVDMLVSIPEDNCGFDERLYLSSTKEAGKLLRKAAQIKGREAACGS